MSIRTADAAVLARYGFRSPERAIAELPERWKDDVRWTRLLTLLGTTPDPDAGLRRLDRLGPDVIARVLSDPEAARPLLRVVGFSDYLTDLLTRTPGLPGEILGDAPLERADVQAFRDAGFVRIAAADLSSTPDRASFVSTTRALTDLADGSLARVLEELRGDAAIAVLGMGKYGAQELNYASDIDVLFVAPNGTDTDAASRVARDVMERMTGPPVIFRTDADLRPEGRDGPLVRSLDAYLAYYSRWAQVWEFQALIKCRFATGDDETGRAFLRMIEPFVWPDSWGPEAIEQIRDLKSRAEREVARRGLGSREVKLGRGGIRDVEFAVQILQLVHGRHHPQLRVRPTLDALDLLSTDGFVAEDDAAELVDAYVFLRHVEHRLQLEGGRQTHTLPTSEAKRELLARSLGFADEPARTALRQFEDAWSKTTAAVRTIHERLFYRPLLEAFAAVPSVRTTMPNEEVDERLAALGFDRPPRVRQAMSMTSGGTRRAKVLRAILPGVLSWMADTPEPDQGMLRLADLAKSLDAMPHLLAVLRDEPPVVELLCNALGTGPVLAGLLERDPTLIGSLVADEHVRDLRSHAVATVQRVRDVDDAVKALRRMKDGHFLRLAARDLASGDEPDVFVSVAAELSDLGDSCLEATLDVARREQAAKTGGPPDGAFAVIGMGRYGGREMSYASDLDVMFVYDHEATCPDGTDARLFHSLVAERVMQLLGSTPPIFKVDAELRPEGRSGPIVRSLESYLVYYDRWAALWEFQALTRARPAAGDLLLGRRLIDAVATRVWRTKLGAEEISEIRKMKARIERERVKGREDPRYQVKLGVGGLADVEFTVQLLQMRHGHTHPSLRTPNTLKAMEALERVGLIEGRDAAWLRDAYLLLNRVRNHMFLLRGLATDALPERDEDLEKLARSLGYGRLSRARFIEHYRRVTRRARRVTDRLFYGEE